MNKKYTIFVSSTFKDLSQERSQVIEAILEMGHIPLGMEAFSAGSEEQWKTIERTIDESDYYVVIIQHQYGSLTPAGDISYTEKEYDYAVSKGIPVLGFIIRDSLKFSDEEKLKRFKEKVMSKMVSFWEGDDLAMKVITALSKEFARSPRPGWVRGTEITSTETANELARLSKENSILQEEIIKKSSMLPDLAIEPRAAEIWIYHNNADACYIAEVSFDIVNRNQIPCIIKFQNSDVKIIIENDDIKSNHANMRGDKANINSLDQQRLKISGIGECSLYATFPKNPPLSDFVKLQVAFFTVGYNIQFNIEIPLYQKDRKGHWHMAS